MIPGWTDSKNGQLDPGRQEIGHVGFDGAERALAILGSGFCWSRVNSAESTVGVQTPLSWSFWERGGEPPFRYAYRQLGFLPRSALESTDVVD